MAFEILINNKRVFFIFVIIFVMLTSSCSQSLKINLKHNGEVNYGRPLTIVIFGQTKADFMKTTVADVIESSTTNVSSTIRSFDTEMQSSVLSPTPSMNDWDMQGNKKWYQLHFN